MSLRVENLVYGGLKLGGFDAAFVFEDDVAGAVVEEGCGKLAGPSRVYEVDGGAVVLRVQEVGGERSRARFKEEVGHGRLYVGDVVERDEREVEMVGRVASAQLDEVGELFAAGPAPRRPEVDEQGALAR